MTKAIWTSTVEEDGVTKGELVVKREGQEDERPIAEPITELEAKQYAGVRNYPFEVN